LKLRIGIVGGSLAGCSAAILLQRAGHKVTVFERSVGELLGRGGGIGTTSTVLNALRTADVIDADFPHLSTSHMPFIGKRGEDEPLGHTPWSLPLDLQAFHWSALWNNLRKRVPDEVYQAGQAVTAATMKDDSTVILQLEDGVEWEFDLVLFADGYRSLGRSLLFPEAELKYRGYMLWRGLLPESEISDSAPLGSTVPRLSHRLEPGNTVMYFIPNESGSTKEGERMCNWASYIPLLEEDIPQFMIDREGNKRTGALPSGSLRIEEEERLKRVVIDNLPEYYGDIIARTSNTFVQLIYTTDIPSYYRDRMCLIGDASAVIQPFTGSGVFKGYNNVRGLIDEISRCDTVSHALKRWNAMQMQIGRRLLALGEQMERAFIWDPLDLSKADAASTEEWWRASVKFPDDFTYEK
jgi:2-polyprenyl-6-methoxyphenol hydroxylase-like FAD-dependent oxidoreductase